MSSPRGILIDTNHKFISLNLFITILILVLFISDARNDTLNLVLHKRSRFDEDDEGRCEYVQWPKGNITS